MAEQDLFPSIVTPSHLQKLMKHGFMSVAELKVYRVPEDPASPTPMEGYVVSFTSFYEREFGRAPHRFVHSLLQYYDLEFHHLTPSGVLHIMTFVTLCEAYRWTNHDFDLWNYFFRVRCLQDPVAELTISEGMIIHLLVEHGVDPYPEISMLRSMKGWWKKWFYLKNDASILLLEFTSGPKFPRLPGERGWLGRTSTSHNPCVSTFGNYGRRG
jgi:hypothetical protein